jgi:hypothetical protein
MQNQVDSLRKLFTGNGFTMVQEARVAMTSEYELPVIVPLKEGNLYQVVFIGDTRSNTYEVRVFDYNEKEIAYRKSAAEEADQNIVTYAFQAKMSEYHMIRPMQVNYMRDKNLCGYFMLLRKDNRQNNTRRN